MSSHRIPQRSRGRDRVAGLMASAAALFVEKGFEAATMTEIASRAGASIGSLYLFFQTKHVLAHAMLAELAETLSARLESVRSDGPPAKIADALFNELTAFLAAHPVYAILMDLPGDEDWRQELRARRRAQLAKLFSAAKPPLRPGQAERLAIIVPQLMRIILTVQRDALSSDGIVEELRLMLHHHLEASVADAADNH